MSTNNEIPEKTHIHIVMSKPEKGMIKKVIAGNKPLADSCLAVLNTLVEFNVDNENLRKILQDLKH